MNWLCGCFGHVTCLGVVPQPKGRDGEPALDAQHERVGAALELAVSAYRQMIISFVLNPHPPTLNLTNSLGRIAVVEVSQVRVLEPRPHVLQRRLVGAVEVEGVGRVACVCMCMCV